MLLIQSLLFAYTIAFSFSYHEDITQHLQLAHEIAREVHIGFDMEGAAEWIGRSSEDVLATFDQPVREDLSAYDYTWWVYTDEQNYVYQFGIKDDQVQTVYVITSDRDREMYDTVNEKYNFQMEVNYAVGESDYTIRLTPEDKEKRPLAKISEDIFVQFYFDSFTKQLAAYRLLNGKTLLTQRPYEIEYRGTLPDQPQLSTEEWREIESGMERQILDVTNVLRAQYGVPTVEWEPSAHQVAYLHSEDMAVNNYFSHISLNGDSLKERLEDDEIVYMHAAENIASGYVDALSAMEGWLNSKSHREAMLNEQYTHLGVGVYRFYYTQNFIQKPDFQ